MFENYPKINGIIKLRNLGLPTPKTLIINDYELQKQEINNFLMMRKFVMIRSEKEGQSTHCPSMIQCPINQAGSFIKELNTNGYAAIVQDYIPLNNIYSGNILVLNDSFIIEVMKGGPVSKLNREGKVDEHLRISKAGDTITHFGSNVIPINDVKKIISKVKDLPLKNHIIEFSSGPDWFYFWHAREDKTSAKLEPI